MKITTFEDRFSYYQDEGENGYAAPPLNVVAYIEAFLFHKKYHISRVSIKIYSDDLIELPLKILSDREFHAIRVKAFNRFDDESLFASKLIHDELLPSDSNYFS